MNDNEIVAFDSFLKNFNPRGGDSITPRSMFIRNKFESEVREIQQKQIGYETEYDNVETTDED